MLRRAARTAAAWVAIVAMALGALWPLVSLARPAGEPMLADICTTAPSGAAAAPRAPTPLPPADHSDDATGAPYHCGLCVSHAERFAAPPSRATWTVAGPVTAAQTLVDDHAQRVPDRHFLPARPRGPPAAQPV
jgi:hypothetical protein